MSYSEENGQVVLRMSREDYELLNYCLKYSARQSARYDEVQSLSDRLNEGNPNYTPYQVPEKIDERSGESEVRGMESNATKVLAESPSESTPVTPEVIGTANQENTSQVPEARRFDSCSGSKVGVSPRNWAKYRALTGEQIQTRNSVIGRGTFWNEGE